MIGVISRNIGELNATYARIGKVDMKEFARLDATLLSILNVSHRRLDGRIKLNDAAK